MSNEVKPEKKSFSVLRWHAILRKRSSEQRLNYDLQEIFAWVYYNRESVEQCNIVLLNFSEPLYIKEKKAFTGCFVFSLR